jgi:hypothetical protein
VRRLLRRLTTRAPPLLVCHGHITCYLGGGGKTLIFISPLQLVCREGTSCALAPLCARWPLARGWPVPPHGQSETHPPPLLPPPAADRRLLNGQEPPPKDQEPPKGEEPPKGYWQPHEPEGGHPGYPGKPWLHEPHLPVHPVPGHIPPEWLRGGPVKADDKQGGESDGWPLHSSCGV